jgi:hypothetical protein
VVRDELVGGRRFVFIHGCSIGVNALLLSRWAVLMLSFRGYSLTLFIQTCAAIPVKD